MDRMSPLDATFLHVEDGINHMHIGSCAIFEGPAPTHRQMEAVLRRKLPLIPRYRQKVRFVPGGVGRPVWVDDPHFDVSAHVHHVVLAPPGDDDALRSLTGRLMSTELDRRRPLWEAWFVEGLAAGRWAMISKVHHCMVDGVSGTDLMATLLDHGRRAAPPVLDRWSPAPEPSRSALLRDALVETAATPGRIGRWAWEAVRRPERAMESAADIVRGARSLGGRLRANTALSIEGAIGRDRRWTWASTTLEDVGRIRHGLGGTVNDVVLAAIALGYRRLLLACGDDVTGQVLHTLVPVSVRAADDHSCNNQVAAILAALPVGLPDPVACLGAVRQQMEELKGSHQVDASVALFNLADVTPPALFAGALRTVTAAFRRLPQRGVNTVATNVRGPGKALYACGREMLEYLPYVPLAQGLRTGVAILSYNGKVAFGVTGDADTMPHLQVLADGIEAGLGELLSAATERAAA